MTRILLAFSLLLFTPFFLLSQVEPTDAKSILEGIENRKKLAESSREIAFKVSLKQRVIVQ
jgi:hypothetical protein